MWEVVPPLRQWGFRRALWWALREPAWLWSRGLWEPEPQPPAQGGQGAEQETREGVVPWGGGHLRALGVSWDCCFCCDIAWLACGSLEEDVWTTYPGGVWRPLLLHFLRPNLFPSKKEVISLNTSEVYVVPFCWERVCCWKFYFLFSFWGCRGTPKG